MEPEFPSEDFLSCSLGGGGRCFSVPCLSLSLTQHSLSLSLHDGKVHQAAGACFNGTETESVQTAVSFTPSLTLPFSISLSLLNSLNLRVL